MLTSRKFIVIIGDDSDLTIAKNIIKGFKAVTVIKTVSQSQLRTFITSTRVQCFLPIIFIIG